MALSRIKRSDIQKKLDELRTKHKETLELIKKLNAGLVQQEKNKAEYEGAIIVLHEILTGEKVE